MPHKAKHRAKRPLPTALAVSLVVLGLSSVAFGFVWLKRSTSSGVGPASETPHPTLLEYFELKAPTPDESAKRLGFVDLPTGLKEAAALFERVQLGYVPNKWAERCKAEHTPLLCDAVDDYFAPKMSAQESSRHRKRLPQPTIKNIANLQKEGFQDVLNALGNFPLRKLRKVVEPVLAYSECPRNLSLALSVSAETLFGDAGVKEFAARLYAHGLECLNERDPQAEFLFLRAGLFRLALGQAADALPLVDRALASEVKREEARAFYWKWKILRALGREPESKVVFQKMRAKYPLAWHSVLAAHESGLDPLNSFISVKAYPDTAASGSPIFDRRFDWFNLMLQVEGVVGSAGLGRYGDFVQQSLPLDGPPGLLQYFARQMEAAGLYRLQILTMVALLQARPEAFSSASMKLLYPKPSYFDTIITNPPGNLDPALLLALARQESSFDLNAISKANARGLFQVLPRTAASLRRKTKATGSVSNIDIGSQFFAKLVKSFDGSVEKALAGYNAGPAMVRKWQERYSFVPFSLEDPQLFADLIPYRETRDYVSGVLRNAYWYHRLYPEFTPSLKPETLTSELLRKLIRR